MDPVPYIQLDPISGERVCTGCATVLEDQFLSEDQEWRTFEDTEVDQSRAERTTARVAGAQAVLETSMDASAAGRRKTGGSEFLRPTQQHTSIVHAVENFSEVIARRLWEMKQEMVDNGIEIHEGGLSRITATGSGVFDPVTGLETPYTEEQTERIERAITRKDNYLREGYRLLNKTATSLRLSSQLIVDRGYRILQYAETAKVFRTRCSSIGDSVGERSIQLPYSRINNVVAAAAIMHAARTDNVSVFFAELTKLTQASKKELKKAFKNLTPYVGFRAEVNFDEQCITLAKRYSQRLGLNLLGTKTVLAFIDGMRNLGLASGKNPVSVVASAIHFVSQYTRTPVTMQRVQEETHVSPYTMMNLFREMGPHEDELLLAFPEAFKRAYDDLLAEEEEKAASSNGQPQRSAPKVYRFHISESVAPPRPSSSGGGAYHVQWAGRSPGNAAQTLIPPPRKHKEAPSSPY